MAVLVPHLADTAKGKPEEHHLRPATTAPKEHRLRPANYALN